MAGWVVAIMHDPDIVVAYPSQRLDDYYGADALEKLGRLGRVITNPHPRQLTSDELFELAPRASIVVDGGRAPVDAAYIARAPELLAYVRAGVEILGVDVAAATEAGVLVANTPGLYNEPIVEYVIAAMVVISRNLIDLHNSLREGVIPQHKMRFELAGQTLGIIGLGEVGRHLARSARALDMVVIGHDPYTSNPPEGVEMVSMEDLLGRSRFVSVQVNLLPSTRGLIGSRELSLMRPDGYLINTARGPIVDEAALADALHAGTIAGAAIDVFASEPNITETPLRDAPNVFLTPHAASSTTQTMARLAQASVVSVEQILRGETPRGVVNPDVLAHARFLNRHA